MFAGKPIIGITGGIGSGKSFVARLFGEAGCLVIASDEQVTDAYQLPEVRDALRSWWGASAFLPSGEVDRRAVAARIFTDAAERQRLEQLLHPLVAASRDQVMRAHADDPAVRAYIWDTPLLIETGLDRACDAVVFVDAPLEQRLCRVQKQRGWDRAQLERRENLQWPLDRKREIADYIITNTADADAVRGQIRAILSLILSKMK